MPQVIVRRPLHELHLRHQFGPHPDALLHLLRREALAPPAGARLGEIRERALPGLQGGSFAISRSRLAGVNPTRVLAT